MLYPEYVKQLQEKGYRLDGDIYRDDKGCPKCYNDVLEDLVVRQQKGVISAREYDLYGRLLMTLVQIVLNNHKFKYQDVDIKDECRDEAYVDVLAGLVKYFDQGRGSTAYAYAFRICYTSMIHVLQRMNIRNDLHSNLIERMNDEILDCGHKVITHD